MMGYMDSDIDIILDSAQNLNPDGALLIQFPRVAFGENGLSLKRWTINI